MKAPYLGVLCLAIGLVCMVPQTVSAEGPSSSGTEMTQYEVAHELIKAIGVDHGTPVASQAMLSLQVRGLVPQSWDGQGTVTMAEMGQIMDRMGIDVGISNPREVVTVNALDRLLRAHQAEMGAVSRDWDNPEGVLGIIGVEQPGRRIISSSGF